MISQERMIIYQDLYKAAWDKQNEIDRSKNSSLRGPQRNYHNRATHIANGKLGGAPLLKLSKEAETINRMLQKEMTIREISGLLGMTVKETQHMVKRFKLPRKD